LNASLSSENLPAFFIRTITAAETLPLRLAVLRPGRPAESARFLGDNDSATQHFGAFQNEKLLGIASLFRAEMPEMPKLSAFQLRGMAVSPEARDAGLGRALTLACIEFGKNNRAELLWCNARTSALAFYRKLGFQIVGEEFAVPDIGPHLRMVLSLKSK